MSFHLVALLVFVLILASAPLTAATLRREAARAAERGEPMPRAANWWLGVRKNSLWLLGTAALALALGFALLRYDREALGRALVITGPALAAYALHAHIVARSIEKALAKSRA